MLNNATIPVAPETFPRASAACARGFFALAHDPFLPRALRPLRTFRLCCFKLVSKRAAERNSPARPDSYKPRSQAIARLQERIDSPVNPLWI